MPVLADKILMRAARFRRQRVNDFFKPFVLAVERGDNFRRDGVQNGAFLLRLCQLCVFKPNSNSSSQCRTPVR